MVRGFVSLLSVFMIVTTIFASEEGRPEKLDETVFLGSGWCGEIAVDDETFQQMRREPLLISKENVAKNYIEFMNAVPSGNLSRYTHLFTKNVRKTVNGLDEAMGVEDLFSQVRKNCVYMGYFWNVILLAKRTESEKENRIKITYTVSSLPSFPQFKVNAVLNFSEEGEISAINLDYTQENSYRTPVESLFFPLLGHETPERPD